jgi:hypothetical protein
MCLGVACLIVWSDKKAKKIKMLIEIIKEMKTDNKPPRRVLLPILIVPAGGTLISDGENSRPSLLCATWQSLPGE